MEAASAGVSGLRQAFDHWTSRLHPAITLLVCTSFNDLWTIYTYLTLPCLHRTYAPFGTDEGHLRRRQRRLDENTDEQHEYYARIVRYPVDGVKDVRNRKGRHGCRGSKYRREEFDVRRSHRIGFFLLSVFRYCSFLHSRRRICCKYYSCQRRCDFIFASCLSGHERDHKHETSPFSGSMQSPSLSLVAKSLNPPKSCHQKPQTFSQHLKHQKSPFLSPPPQHPTNLPSP